MSQEPFANSPSPQPPYQDPGDFSVKPRSNMAVVYIVCALLVALGGGMVFLKWKQYSDRAAIESWIRDTPVNAMVLARHPSPQVADRFRAHFNNYYFNSGGQAGLALGQLEMQQIINVNYLSDFIWTVKDENIREYLKQLYFLTASLVKVDGGRPGLCEKYFADSSKFSEVDKAVGGNIFADYMAASADLVLSARDNKPYAIQPGTMDYMSAKQRANAAFWTKFRENHPSYSNAQLVRVAQGFNPLVSCAGYAEYLRSMLQLENEHLSIQWRSGMEADRPALEARRKASGSE